MSKKIVNRFFMLLVLLFIVIYLTSTTSLATGYLNPDTIKPNNNGNLATTTQGIAGSVLAVAQVIGVAVAVIMLIVLAIKYMTSAPNDRAEIKKHAVVYIVGAVVLFAASGILGIIRGFANPINNGSQTATKKDYLESQLKTLKEEQSKNPTSQRAQSIKDLEEQIKQLE